MQQMKKEYMLFSTKINNYLSKLIVEQKIDFEEYHYSLICEIIQSEGVVIRDYSFKETTIGGMLVQDQMETTIGVNQNLSNKNRNLVISRMMAHYLFHLDQKKVIFIDTMKDLESLRHLNVEDFQANIGASAILVPDKILISFLKKGWELHQLSERFGIAVNQLCLRLVQMLHVYSGLSVNDAKTMLREIQYKHKKTKSVQLGVMLESEEVKK